MSTGLGLEPDSHIFFFFLPLRTQLDPDPQQPNNTSKKWNAACGRMKHGVLVPEFPEVLAPSSQTSEELYSMSSVTWPLSTIFRPNTPLSPGFYNITYRYTKLVRTLLPTLYAVPIKIRILTFSTNIDPDQKLRKIQYSTYMFYNLFFFKNTALQNNGTWRKFWTKMLNFYP